MAERKHHAGLFKKGVSGNPAGPKPGTRPKRMILQEALEKVAARKKIDPVEFMLEILSDPSYGLTNRKWAADKVAPYVRSKMPIRVDTGPPPDDLAAQLRAELAAMQAVTAGTEQPIAEPVRRRVRLLTEE